VAIVEGEVVGRVTVGGLAREKEVQDAIPLILRCQEIEQV